MMMRKRILVTVLAATLTSLLIGTLTPIFSKIEGLLPKRTDLFLHLIAHTILTLSAYHLLTSTPAEAIVAASMVLALVIELLQHVIKKRSASLGDMAAATVGSFAPFLAPKDGRFVAPSLAVLSQYLFPEDDDDDDEHRVGSWAV